ncbi:MAG: thiamine diphosphokinase [Acidimicrobiaceae bacterium]|nr:thiamine diphosphokinase [Acidimicrobiaceae bacterium]
MDRPGGAGVSARHALVVTGGPSPAGLADLPARELVIAADRGAEHALALGLEVDLVVGDLDSIDPDTLVRLQEGGTRVEHHPADKDETDLELALAAALEAGATSATIVGSASGRLDHALGILLAGAGDRWAGLRIDLRIDAARAWIVRDRLEVHGEPDTVVSLLAVGGPATGVTTTGLRWRLADAVMSPGIAVGLSNLMTGPTATVTVGTGTLLVVQPGREAA